MPEVFDEAYDQRLHRRVSVNLQARMNFGGRWQACEVIDLSGGGAMVRAEITPAVDSTILIQLRGVGIIRAQVKKKNGQSFAVSFNRQDYDVDAMVDNLMLQANSEVLGLNAAVSRPQASAPVVPVEQPDQDEGNSETILEASSGRRLRAIIGS